MDATVIDLGDSYEGTLRRSKTNTWLCYIRLPAGHCCIGKEYITLGYNWSFPVELTYGPTDIPHLEDRRADTFGFDGVILYENALNKLKELKKHFQELETTHREEILAD